ncbi:MAG: hypothetical protein Ta2A_11860 [Treponemataceae bacterium]|nr:MAG: hypothetical protein Ta2A_11860 [Treponemataceae bacterium]
MERNDPRYVSRREIQDNISRLEILPERQQDENLLNQGIWSDFLTQKFNYGERGLKSIFFDPLSLQENGYGGKLNTISHFNGRTVSFRVLRRVAEKAFIINLCISNVIRKIRPFLKPTTTANLRGFQIKPNFKENNDKLDDSEKQTVKQLEKFFLNTGFFEDKFRKSDLDMYVTAIVRDLFTLDQITTEIQRDSLGTPKAFWAVDPATIEVTMPHVAREYGIEYVQMVNQIPYATYKHGDLLVRYMNARTDIERAGYGYSVTEQAIDLVTSAINTFAFNAGYFQENKLPRGMVFLNGDAGPDDVEEMTEYMINFMSGTPTSQWKIPIVPSGKDKSGDSAGRTLEWVPFDNKNNEMQFQEWYYLQLSAISAMYGSNLEDVGLHAQSSAPLIENNQVGKIQASKTAVLGDTLTFLQKNFNDILHQITPKFDFEFVGFEVDDPKVQLDIDKEEVNTYKTLNEKRIEKGLNPISIKDAKDPADLPLDPQVTQRWQALQAQQQGGMDGGLPPDDGGFTGGDTADEDAWGETQAPSDEALGETADETANDAATDTEDYMDEGRTEKAITDGQEIETDPIDAVLVEEESSIPEATEEESQQAVDPSLTLFPPDSEPPPRYCLRWSRIKNGRRRECAARNTNNRRTCGKRDGQAYCRHKRNS